MEDSTVYAGTVKSYNPAKGWGFVHSPDTDIKYGEGIFLLKSELKDAVGCWKGDRVKFWVTKGKKGPQAKDVQLIGPSDEEDHCFFGTVRGLGGNKGWGFINCTLAKETHGKDVFLTAKSIPEGIVPDGTEVQFKVRMEDKGPCATDVKVMAPLGSGKGGKGSIAMYSNGGKGYEGPSVPMYSNGGKGYGGDFGKGGWGHPPPPPHGYDPYGPSYGYGAPPPPPQYGWGGPPPPPHHQWGAPPPPGYAQGWGGPPQVPPGWGAPPPGHASSSKGPDEKTHYYGTLKAMNTEKGWGHIDCSAMKKLYGKDMFVMKTNLEGRDLSEGQQVSFRVQQGPKGPHAVDLTPISDSETLGQTFTGSVKNFNEQKGWGFIQCEQTMELFKQDIFLHKNDLNNISPTIGEKVHFSVDLGGGRPTAKHIMLMGTGHGGSDESAGLNRSAPY
jgi:cold shock CspA family protein